MKTWRGRTLRATGIACLTASMAAAAAVPAMAGQNLRPGHVRSPLQPWPVTITIKTVPALPGVGFIFDGIPLVTDSKGVTSFTERHNFDTHTLGLARTEVSATGRRYTFLRWAGQRDPNQAFRPTVGGLPMRADYTVTASFATACPVSPQLVEQNGIPLPAQEVSRITVLSSIGQPAALSPSGTTWLPCAVPVYRDGVLSSRSVQYSVQSVLVGGSNVVRAGVERFEPGKTAKPTVTGFFYSLTITAHDAMLGGALGRYALLTLPNGDVRRVELGPRHTATVADLPIGDYQVQVKAGGATVSAETVHLSRDQTANLAAVTRTDILIVGVALAIGLVGAPLLSRTRRKRMRARLARASTSLRRARNTERADAGHARQEAG